MTTTQLPNLSHLLHRLGDIDPDRVLMPPAPGTATEADLLACPRKFVELVDGVLVEKAMGMRESYWAGVFVYWLMDFLKVHKLGIVPTPDGLHRLSEDVIRQPDVSFTSWANLPDDRAHMQPVGDYAPDLAIEILSISDRPGETRRRLEDYFAAGTKLVWVVDPRAETVMVYTDVLTSSTLTRHETLTAGSVLPGFGLRLLDLFDDPQLKPRPANGA
jgi:Uma2 family endonuclease